MGFLVNIRNRDSSRKASILRRTAFRLAAFQEGSVARHFPMQDLLQKN